MKKFILLSINLLAVTFIIAQSWVQKNDFPGLERYAATGLNINGKLYMGTGYNGVTMMNDWWEYDPATGQWSQKANFPGAARFHASSFTINGKGYVVLGSSTYPNYTFPTDMWEYDPVLNQWTQKANFPGLGRYTAVGMEIKGYGYVGTGWRSGTFYSDWWEYNQSTNSWTQRANLPGGTRQAAYGFSLNDKGFVGLGTKSSTIFNDFYEYNPLTNTWITKANFPAGSRAAGAAFAINGFGYVGTGIDGEFGNTVFSDYHKFDPMANSWTSINGFNPGRISPVTLVANNCAFIITGKETPFSDPIAPQNTLKDFWELCLLTNVNNNTTENNYINTYPNPWTHILNIDITAVKTEVIKIELFNSLGVKVADLYQGMLLENQTYKINFIEDELSAGIYLIGITGELTSIHYKIIKVN